MAPDPKDLDTVDHEHHQGGAEPAKPEHIGLNIASKKGTVEEKGKNLGESEGAHDPTKKSSGGDRKL
jgi:hypothetical protein